MKHLLQDKQLRLFLSVLVGIGSIFYIAIAVNGSIHGSNVLLTLLMWAPGVAALIVKLKYRKGVHAFGLKPHQPLYMLLSYLIPIISTFIIYNFAWISKTAEFHSMSTPMIIGNYTVGIIICSISTIGEELGWRGFLMHVCNKHLSFLSASVFVGVIWFLYHLPMILFTDYNNGNVIFSMISFFISIMGFTLVTNFMTVKGRCIWPAVLLHSSDNISLSVFNNMTVMKKVSPYIVTEFGAGYAIVYLIAGLIVCGIILHTRRKQ